VICPNLRTTKNGCLTKPKMAPPISLHWSSIKDQTKMREQAILLEKSKRKNSSMMKSMILISSSQIKSKPIKREIRKTISNRTK